MSKKPLTRRRKPAVKQPAVVLEPQSEQVVVPYDENLLERARTQWQFGDWASLAKLDRDTLQHHPDRAKLALLAAAGRLQTGNDAEARQFIRLAQDWGVSTKLISQILVSGVYNSLARAAMCMGDSARSHKNFENAILVLQKSTDVRLVAEARAAFQGKLLGLNVLSSNTALVSSALQMNSKLQEFYILRIRLRLGSFASIDLGFNTANARWLSTRHDVIDYQTENKSPLYLVSNESGDFERPPQQIQIPISADMPYLLSGEIVYNGENSPVIWIFQYSGGRKVHAQSIPAVGGRIRHGFKTLPTTESIAIGIRLAGSGQLNLRETALSLRERVDEDFIAQIDPKNRRL